MSFERLSISRFIDQRALALQGKGMRLVASYVQAIAQDVRNRFDIAGPDLPLGEKPAKALLRLALEGSGFEMQDALRKSRKPDDVTRFRHAAIWAAEKRFGLTPGQMAKQLECDQASVRNSIEQGEILRERDEDFRELTDTLLCAAPRCPHCNHQI